MGIQINWQQAVSMACGLVSVAFPPAAPIATIVGKGVVEAEELFGPKDPTVSQVEANAAKRQHVINLTGLSAEGVDAVKGGKFLDVDDMKATAGNTIDAVVGIARIIQKAHDAQAVLDAAKKAVEPAK